MLKKISRSEGIKDFYAKVEKIRDRAKKDNDLIYHEIIPDPKTLPSIGVAPVAKRLPVTFPLAGKPPKELFTTLVPIPVHNATQVADGVRRQMIAVEVGRLREATDACNGMMASLNLPAAVQEINGSDDAVLKTLLEKAAAIRHNGGVASLREKISSLADGNTRNAEIAEDVSFPIILQVRLTNLVRLLRVNLISSPPSIATGGIFGLLLMSAFRRLAPCCPLSIGTAAGFKRLVLRKAFS